MAQLETIRLSRQPLHLLPLICIALLVLLSAIMLAPTCPDRTVATTISYLPSTVTLSMQTQASTTVDPTVNGRFEQTNTTIGVKVTNSENFTVSLKGNPYLTGSNGNLSTIEPVANNTPAENFTNNTWGYSWAKGSTPATVYNPVPADYVKLEDQTTVNSAADETYTLSFGAKVDTTLPADFYKSAVTISVVASPKVVIDTSAKFSNITYMQEMTLPICAAAQYGETAQLTDRRDGKKYWVTKLADGNCWMTQNLDLNIPSTGLSKATGSKLDWNPNNATNTTNLSNNTTQTNTNSWDQGMYVYNTPTASVSCGSSLSGISVCTGGAANSGKTFINVDGYTASDDPDFTHKNGSPVNTNTKIYDAHYLIGNYYSFNAATAGTGAAVTANGANASSDICPAGSGGIDWVLPSSGEANNSGNSFYRMLVAQGMTGLASADDGSVSISTNITAKTFLNAAGITTPVTNLNDASTASMTINNALTTAPLFFVRGGVVNSNSTLLYPGRYSLHWSRSSQSSTSVFSLYFGNSPIKPSYYGSRYYGYSVRCLFPAA